jgi:hypothetical protein
MMADAEGATHLASWLPARFISSGQGFWELRTIDAWNARPSEAPIDCADLPRNAAAPSVARWISEFLQFPVYLTAGEQELPRSFGRWSAEPLFFVRRAA